MFRKVNRRKFLHTPPSFPYQYDKQYGEEGYTYQCMYFSHKVDGLLLQAISVVDYMGDIIYGFLEQLEVLQSEKLKVRTKLKRSPIRTKLIRKAPDLT